ncbi:MAG: transketolase [Candidatus Marsarchaeota archaeon]|nr:transketolase [Candidatus Marsarchaeota archaeon]MCL5413460.1 transketolase [Candidatus Marsarchaeota archaeon]
MNIDFKSRENRPGVDAIKKIAAHIREDIVLELAEAKSGHPGGSLSCTDILACLYFNRMRHDPKNPRWERRDRMLLSKGHAAPALYATLAECGYIPKEELKTLRKINSRLQGHGVPIETPGVEIPGGPEGIGLSEGIGMAFAARHDKNPARIYVVMGDGELDEGECWEAAMAAAKLKLSNLTAIIDKNGLQQEGKTADIMPSDPVPEKFRAFNWNVIEIDGNEIKEIIDALDKAEAHESGPTAIIAHTVKGKGISFMEGKVEYHAKSLSAEIAEQALNEIRNSPDYG